MTTTTNEQAFESFFETAETLRETELPTALDYRFQTRFGGVFYLLNLGLFLGLYRDFTEAPAAEIDLNIWDFVALAALEFLGDEIKTDAVWSFLKSAAGREDEREFGREFDRRRDWRLPPAWLAAFPPNEPWSRHSTKNRLVVRHPDGFNVIDIRRRGRAEKQLAGELAAFRRNFSRIEKAGVNERLSHKSKDWLANLFEFLRRRLYRALGLRTNEELNAVLFARRAGVTVSATHLEITFALADLPIEVRLAGIDRDPAWIPAAGRYVYFHFE